MCRRCHDRKKIQNPVPKIARRSNVLLCRRSPMPLNECTKIHVHIVLLSRRCKSFGLDNGRGRQEYASVPLPTLYILQRKRTPPSCRKAWKDMVKRSTVRMLLTLVKFFSYEVLHVVVPAKPPPPTTLSSSKDAGTMVCISFQLAWLGFFGGFFSWPRFARASPSPLAPIPCLSESKSGSRTTSHGSR